MTKSGYNTPEITKIPQFCLLVHCGQMAAFWQSIYFISDKLYALRPKTFNNASSYRTLPYIVLNISLIFWRWSLLRPVNTSMIAFSSVPRETVKQSQQ